MGEFTKMISIKPVLPNSTYASNEVLETTIAKNQPPYKPLHVARVLYCDGTISMISCYKLAWKERLRVFIKGLIWCEQLTFGNPRSPERLTVYEPLSALDIESEPAMDLTQGNAKIGLK